jgi:5'-3' exonuclease
VAARRKLFGKHPDSNLFGSLPGVGEKLGLRLLREMGSDRSLYSNPDVSNALREPLQ